MLMSQCDNILDLGIGEPSFRCDLEEGHSGCHKAFETKRLVPYAITWGFLKDNDPESTTADFIPIGSRLAELKAHIILAEENNCNPTREAIGFLFKFIQELTDITMELEARVEHVER